METLKLADALEKEKAKIAQAARAGKIFICPTDTLYVIGCDASSQASVNTINHAKGEPAGKAFQLIVPSLEWVKANASVSEANFSLMKSMLPGPYTFILKSKRGGAAPRSVISEGGTIGICIPKHKFTDIIRELGMLFATTTLKEPWEEPVHSLEQVPEKMRAAADFAVDAGKIDGHPSRVFDLTGEETKILR